jgi:ABC-2 type transport system permease protein
MTSTFAATAEDARPAAARGRVLLHLTRTELTLFRREYARPIAAVGVPMALLVIFGVIPFYSQRKPDFGGLTLFEVYVPILIALALAMLSLNILAPALAGYRERGVLRRLRTTPAGPVRVLAAQLIVDVVVEAVTVLLLLAVARLAFHAFLPRQAAGFVIAAALAALALIAMGLLVAACVPTARTGNAVGLLLFYVMMFFAGLFFPVNVMPPVLQHISHGTPLGAAVLALTDATQGQFPPALPLVTMAVYALAFGAAAVRLFRWE